MSKPQFDAFFDKVMGGEYKDELSQIEGDAEKKNALIAEVARGAGFDVTAEDVAGAGLGYGKEGPLADEELELIAGGCGSNCTDICGMFLGHWMGRQ